MICQVCPVKTKTAPLPRISKALTQVRNLQARVKERAPTYPVDRSQLWSPLTAGPYIVPVSRWIE
jgi:hypothetical protein